MICSFKDGEISASQHALPITQQDISLTRDPTLPSKIYQNLLQRRRSTYGFNTSLSYEEPLLIVKGKGCYLYDEHGNQFLDAINNVAHVGHCHPKVNEAVIKQLNTLNTNSRFLSEPLIVYTEELLATFPDSFKVVYLCNSGSEGNDLALRIAQACRPGAKYVAVMASAYHGHLTSLIELSSYKFWGKGGAGRPDHVVVLPCPDPYRGENLDGRRAAQAALAAVACAGGQICAFICESILSCGGQITPPANYLKDVYEEMHSAGAICIADEVQCGFGRVGEAFWSFQAQGVVPDIVTLGKSMGNGFPVSGLVTTRKLAECFSKGGMEYFNTFGGSTASCVSALSTLRVCHEEGLQGHAKEVGQYLIRSLKSLQSQFPSIGEVRGSGFMLGIEIVSCLKEKTHAPLLAQWIKERMKARFILLSTDGPYANVLKIKPPMSFAQADADTLVGNLREVLTELHKPSNWETLMEKERQHSKEVVCPLQTVYKENEQFLFSRL